MKTPEFQISLRAFPSVEVCVQCPPWKRTIDVACCVLALPALGLVGLVMTAITKLVAPGPVLFRQERIGYMGRRFLIYKFRTMYVGADTGGHQTYFKQLIGNNAPMLKLDARGDARLIPGCRLLRAAGLDELPQIINVLRGEMSIVGPRPCIPTEYESFLPWQRERCASVPGLTGLWQVSGKNRTTFEEMMRLDIRYGRTLSWWRDLEIILLTVPALLQQIADNRSRSIQSMVKLRPSLRACFPTPSIDSSGDGRQPACGRGLGASKLAGLRIPWFGNSP